MSGEMISDFQRSSIRMETPLFKCCRRFSQFRTVIWDVLISPSTRLIKKSEELSPIQCNHYHARPTARMFSAVKIDKMMSGEVIETAKIECTSPIVFAPRKDGSLRFYIYYRKSNAVTIRDSYPLPHMDECIDSLGDATVLSTLDANSGYWLIEIENGDRDKTAFTSHYALYLLVCMPFGLKNAIVTFQRAMDVVLASMKWQLALVYLDEIIAFLRTPKEHIVHVRRTLQLLYEAGVNVKLKKCKFFRKSLTTSVT